MPTGYTAAIKDDISFNQFVWGCARGMGAFVMMRDEPSDAEIPQQFDPNNYHYLAIISAKEELLKVHNMTVDECNKASAAAHKKEVASNRKYIKASDDLKIKYESMLAKVLSWKPPTPDHVNFKDFMIEQIQSSIKFDCNSS